MKKNPLKTKQVSRFFLFFFHYFFLFGIQFMQGRLATATDMNPAVHRSADFCFFSVLNFEKSDFYYVAQKVI